MNIRLVSLTAWLALLGASLPTEAATWQTLVNNSDTIPGSTTFKFYSYSAPSVNGSLLTTFRGQAANASVNGVFVRSLNLSTLARGNVLPLLRSGATVPQPNALGALFDDSADFPRISKLGSDVGTVGLHDPVWPVGSARIGTSGIYAYRMKTYPFAALTAVGQLGSVPEFSFWQVPTATAGTVFERFSHPSPLTIRNVFHIVFRGEYQDGGAYHGIFFRALDATGTSRVVALVDTKTTLIPDLVGTRFGYFSAPSGGGYDTVAVIGCDKAVDWTTKLNPTWCAVSKMHVQRNPYFPRYIKLGFTVPGTNGARFNRFGDAVSWNGRFILFWGSWGPGFKPVKMVCPTEGDPDTINLCNQRHPGNVDTPTMWVPTNQGIVLFDDRPKTYRVIDRTSGTGDDFVFWKYSAQDDRWYPSIQFALDSEDNNLLNPTPWVGFKMRKGTFDAGTGLWSTFSDHIYLTIGSGAKTDLVATGVTAGQALDTRAAGMTVTDVELEREGLRNKIMGISARMRGPGGEWAGIYLSRVVP